MTLFRLEEVYIIDNGMGMNGGIRLSGRIVSSDIYPNGRFRSEKTYIFILNGSKYYRIESIEGRTQIINKTINLILDIEYISELEDIKKSVGGHFIMTDQSGIREYKLNSILDNNISIY